MPRDPAPTREKLLRAAERLFSSRGLDVSLEAITRAARQRNNASVQYHFGGREGLLRAIVARHLPRHSARRAELVAAADSEPGDLRRLAAAIVCPITEAVEGDWEQRAFVRIEAFLLTDPTRTDRELSELLHDPLLDAIVAELSQRRDLEPTTAYTRTYLLSRMVLHVCADRARTIDSRPPTRRLVSPERFVAELLDLSTAALAAPVTPHTHPGGPERG